MNDLSRQQYDVFISYRRRGGLELARQLAQQFNRLGLKCFFDLEEIRTGQFNTKIYDSIASAKYVIVVASRGAFDRCPNEGDWVRNELEYAYNIGKRVIPVAWKGTAICFPVDLPKKLNRLPNTQVAFIDKDTAFIPTVRQLISDHMPGVVMIDERKRRMAEEAFVKKARRFKNNDCVIDSQERAELIAFAQEVGIDAITREILIEQVESESVAETRGVQSFHGLEARDGFDIFEQFKSSIHKTICGTFDYHGRSTRTEYWLFFLSAFITWFLSLIIDVVLDFECPYTMFLASLAIMFPFCSLCVRRVRDMRHNPLWLLLCLVPFVGWILVLYLGIGKSR